MLPTGPRLLFPHRDAPLRALARRLGIAASLLVFVALVTWLGRGGYRDADGGPLTVLDTVYYASVTLTTTGYGDITPVTATARAVTAFVVTPARILFLIVLIGTTLEVLTEQFRQSLAESRWRNRVKDHIIVAGYGTKGRAAVASLTSNSGTPLDHIIVIDSSEAALREARAAGLTVVLGNATRIAVLRHAAIEEAAALIVTTDRDDTATLITLTARELNARVTISASVREAENAHLLRQSGADTVIVSAEAAGRLLGFSTQHPSAVAVFEDLLVADEGLQLVERPIRGEEVAGPPDDADGNLPIALVRSGRNIPFDADGFQSAEPGDVVVSISSQPAP